MGLLEEAIREHLELKRQHGASDEELLQEEADALGPTRREELAVDAEPESGGDGAVAEEELEGEELPAEPPEAQEPPMPAEEPLREESSDSHRETPGQDGLGSEQEPRRDFDFD